MNLYSIKTKLILLIIAVTLISCIDEKNKIEVIDDETFIAYEDNENLKLAVSQAQTNLNYFIEKLKTHSKDTNYWFSAKTKIEYQEQVHHFWFHTLEFKNNDSFIGILHNDIKWSNTMKTGDTIYVHKNDIEDWYIENGMNNKIEGDFAEKILFQNK